jgi:hypothetical protein
MTPNVQRTYSGRTADVLEQCGGAWASKPYELTAYSSLWNDRSFQGVVEFRVMRTP